MFKRSMIVMLVIIMALSAGIMAFSEVETTEDYVYIISPEVGTSGKAILNDTLFISVYVESEKELVLELVKKTDFTFDDEIGLIPYEEPEIIEDKISLSDVQTHETTYTKKEIIASFQMAQTDLQLTKEAYDKAKLAAAAIVTDVDTYILKTSDQMVVDNFETASTVYNQALLNFNYWQAAYMKLFDSTIIKGMKMTVDPEFPYFEYAVDDIEPGNYQLSVKGQDGSMIETLNFEVVTEDFIADEILENNDFFDNFIDAELFE